jgi:hypothetical protein
MEMFALISDRVDKLTSQYLLEESQRPSINI